MSATINQAQFSDYFGGAPCIEIPGYVSAGSHSYSPPDSLHDLHSFTHPVQDHYLEDILPHLPNFSATGKPARKASQEQLDRMRASFMSRGVHDERTLMTLETLTRSEKLDFGLVGATVSLAFSIARTTASHGHPIGRILSRAISRGRRRRPRLHDWCLRNQASRRRHPIRRLVTRTHRSDAASRQPDFARTDFGLQTRQRAQSRRRD